MQKVLSIIGKGKNLMFIFTAFSKGMDTFYTELEKRENNEN